MINIDKAKNIIGIQIFNTINECNTQQLDKWRNDLKIEIEREGHKSERSYRLQYELLLIESRL